MNQPEPIHETHQINQETINLIATQANRWAGPAVSVISYGLIIGFALTGLAMMTASALAWLMLNASWLSGFGLLTGGIFFSSAAALFLGKLTKVGDSLYQNRRKQPAT
ncbi:MAG: hypothetical protein KJO21_12230 [Verrucomicrobiae bacterium]|nr:hypothetical protein [Verrucomicrobiae bacterium]NNJ43987.1 hypothetical protein [Akkermansiaceae bacterium]